MRIAASLVMDWTALDPNPWHGVLRKEESGQEDAASLARWQLGRKAFRLVQAHPQVTDVQAASSELCRLAVRLCQELRRAKPGVLSPSRPRQLQSRDKSLVFKKTPATGHQGCHCPAASQSTAA